MTSPRFTRLDFVGGDDDSDREHCPAVFVDPLTGDFFFQGRRVTDPAVLEMLAEHAVLASDEEVVWLPARMRQVILDALTGYEEGRVGHGAPDFEQMLAGARRSAVHLELRDFYGPSEDFESWRSGGPARLSDDGGRWDRLIGGAVSRGVTVRRVRVISRPASAYSRWLHMVTGENIQAGEDVRWLWRPDALGLLLPHTDLWMFDQRLVAFNHNNGEGEHVPGYTYVTDPREIPAIVAAVEMAWERATPHEKFDIDG
ncbi:hypothetical protein Misp01_46320 [Microtetraspora sp. NBRC 13810]|uniref:DUF6879 family protein n=1 Tax=Microtetraspora sp. NBRC 13810 TaxID=3030990 RepID=UPI0024A28A5D|nr:DUF6879 family protein [Microtetraspora sp. NBRC 13810]GLW09503.1 hypothetical protein Misp01_46320 [Microtetraspora sp. NBRC 13810]